MKIQLYQLDKNLKKFIALFLTILTIGMMVGLVYLNLTTDMSIDGTKERWNGTEDEKIIEFEIPDEYPKSISQMLVTTHTHVISFTLIFGIVGFLFYFNSVIGGFWKKFLMIEPLISVVITFGSIWLMRFIEESFVYLTILSATIMYISFFFVVFTMLFELLLKKIN